MSDYETTGAAAARPLRYESSYEQPEDGEAETTATLIETLRKIAETTHENEGHGLRSVHAKTHGLLHGQLTVLPGLTPELAQGLFAQAGTYPVVMRLSTVPGDVLADSVSTPRGLAVKVIGVDGARLPGSEADLTQDFVLVDGPAFGAPDAKHFLKNLKMLAGTTDKGEGLKKAFSALARGAEKVVESVGGQSSTLVSLGGHPETHILGETFYTQVPLLYGDYMAKVSIAPVSSKLAQFAKAPVDLSGKPNGLREAVVDHFATTGGEWEVRVQLCTDLETMPIENAATVWPEDQSPYVAVARITVEPQIAWSDASAKQLEDGLSFSPWHGLAAHRPIGSIMRVRKAVYETMAALRARHNGRTIAEPRSTTDLGQ